MFRILALTQMISLALLTGFGVGLVQAETALISASPEPGWPQFRGPRRDGICTETNLLQSWPPEGPPRLWTVSGFGRGYSSPIVVGDSIFITGDIGDDLCIFALDLEGKIKWCTKNGRAWTKNYPGARASCTYAQGRIYHLNAHGRCVCLDAANGKEFWAVNILERFDAVNTEYGLSESVLVDSHRVYVTPGGRGAFIAALDRNTGETVWRSEPLDKAHLEPVGNASPLLFQLGGRRFIVNLSRDSVVCVDADTGKIQWNYRKPSPYRDNCAIPLLVDDCIFHSNPSGSGGRLLRMVVDQTGVKVQLVWECVMDNVSGGFVLVDGFIYGSGHYNSGWTCIDVRTGRQMYDSREISRGAVLYADGRLYCLSERGEMVLVKPTPEAFETVGRLRVTDGQRGDCWAHPAICDGRLYVRYHDVLHAYNVRRH
ncbi:MAG: PQQ-binding-like beta-propeller repeat protein [Kiritimatiellae bacterium]|nr:PQQ-binding-like beta-propeller repeat protein [Kiritimatiellia bacterium]